MDPDGQRFTFPQLAPRELLPQRRSYRMIVDPLYFREEQLGFALFEIGPREGNVYRSLREEISGALQRVLLNQRIRERTAELAREKYITDTFLATVPDRIYFKDRQGRISRANRAYAQRMGFERPSEVPGKTDFDFFPPEDVQIRYAQEQEILRTGEPLINLEEQSALPNDLTVWSLATKMPLRDEHGEIIGTFGISRDITDIKRAEQELRQYRNHLEDLVEERTAEISRINTCLRDEILERSKVEQALRISEQQYRLLAGNVMDGIVIVQNGKILFTNTVFAAMIRQQSDLLFGIELTSFFSEPGKQIVQTWLTPGNYGTSASPCQAELIARDGQTIWTEIEHNEIVWNGHAALLLTVRDITNRKFREQRLEEERVRLQQENLTLKSSIRDRFRFGELVGKSLAMQRVYELIVSAATLDVNVLLCGESGTGKELIAKTIHQISRRKDQPFVPVNCASIPETLFEREFFGHRRGAFTGADRNTPGFFDRAHQGTLFLDEVTELSPATQAKLLRVLQDGEYTPLGSNKSEQADVLIISATNKNCQTELESERLRKDFFYRIGIIEIVVPPLRDRKDDLPLLIEHILDQYRQKQAHLPMEHTKLPGEFVQTIHAYNWPGNVRELQNVLQRYLATQDLTSILSLIAAPASLRALSEFDFDPAVVNLPETMKIIEKRIINDMLAQNHYRTSTTAKKVGIPLRTLQGKIQKYQLREDK